MKLPIFANVLELRLISVEKPPINSFIKELAFNNV